MAWTKLIVDGPGNGFACFIGASILYPFGRMKVFRAAGCHTLTRHLAAGLNRYNSVIRMAGNDITITLKGAYRG